MTRRNALHTNCIPVTAVSINEAVPEGPGAVHDGKTSTGITSVQRVDDLLRAFSDNSFSSEEETLPWESWNYNRLSTF